MSFDGINDVFSAQFSQSLNTIPTITVELLVLCVGMERNSPFTFVDLLASADLTTLPPIFRFGMRDGLLWVQDRSPNSNKQPFTDILQPDSTPSILDNAWHHIAVVLTQGNIDLTSKEAPPPRLFTAEIFIDGKQVVKTTYYRRSSLFTIVSMRVGGYTNQYPITGDRATSSQSVVYFQGSMDEIRLWFGSRTAGQLSAWMFRPINATQYPNLQSYFNFDDTDVVLADR